ncbi:hypothetical protein DL96DRAFT_570040 [Flagelloscypha sp. PMI_526]|nr:hypothetical protein DL96DRAFT_570040 [Flagelloscypha sp. PMI_526]
MVASWQFYNTIMISKGLSSNSEEQFRGFISLVESKAAAFWVRIKALYLRLDKAPTPKEWTTLFERVTHLEHLHIQCRVWNSAFQGFAAWNGILKLHTLRHVRLDWHLHDTFGTAHDVRTNYPQIPFSNITHLSYVATWHGTLDLPFFERFTALTHLGIIGLTTGNRILHGRVPALAKGLPHVLIVLAWADQGSAKWFRDEFKIPNVVFAYCKINLEDDSEPEFRNQVEDGDHLWKEAQEVLNDREVPWVRPSRIDGTS